VSAVVLGAPAVVLAAAIAMLVAPAVMLAAPGTAAASMARLASVSPNGVEHFHFAAGPYTITPGANLILAQANKVPTPHQNGFMIRMAPNLRYALPGGKCCGKVPPTDVVHLHHGVWITNGADGQGEGNGFGGLYPFMAAGEEKTIYEFPSGYGYPIGANDAWILNYMIHNLTNITKHVYVTYDIDFVPESSPLASKITPVHPIWMDVQDHHIYPVFNVKRFSGSGGRFTYPDMARDPYGSGAPLNEFTIDHPGVLVATAGHLHPGGLYDDLDLTRPGAAVDPHTVRVGSNTVRVGSNTVRVGSNTVRVGSNTARVGPNNVRLFRSSARYFDRHGPVSWDFAMTATAPDWRPRVQAGDVLSVHATYETRRASWWEVMGIMVVWEAWSDQRGINPFAGTLDEVGHVTHGRLPENQYFGGTAFVGVNPNSIPSCHPREVVIAGFRYLPGDISSRQTDRNACVPTIRHGQSLRFVNEDASAQGTFGNLFSLLKPNPFYLASIFHTVTSCKKPCTLNYGVNYPLANGPGKFDSGELGAGTPGVGRLSWNTPTTLPPGTYTFFCRIHPWMRGVFRVIG
jgi:hypothetical protein